MWLVAHKNKSDLRLGETVAFLRLGETVAFEDMYAYVYCRCLGDTVTRTHKDSSCLPLPCASKRCSAMLCVRAATSALTVFSWHRNRCKASAAAPSSLRPGRNTSCKTTALTEDPLFSGPVFV